MAFRKRRARAKAIAALFGALVLCGRVSAWPVVLICNMDNGDLHRVTFDEQARSVNGHLVGDKLAEDKPAEIMGQPTTRYRRHRVAISSKTIESFDGIEDVMPDGNHVYTSSTDIVIDRTTGAVVIRLHDGLLNGLQTMDGHCETNTKKSPF